jgi:hypothetical protein
MRQPIAKLCSKAVVFEAAIDGHNGVGWLAARRKGEKKQGAISRSKII